MPRRIALFGQAAFARDVLVRLLEAGHQVVGVYAPPDANPARPDPLAEEAAKRGLRLSRYKAFRRQGQAIPERVAEYRELGAELNVMPYTTVILPPEIVEAPALGSLCFHPSLLPKYRGGAAIPWQIVLGERETGVTVFRPDAGVDTGPIVVQRGGVSIEDRDNAATLYFGKLYPLGVEAMIEAVDAVDRGRARPQPQDESAASFQGLLTDEQARIDWERPGEELDRLVRGCDPSPGAWAWREAPGPPGHEAWREAPGPPGHEAWREAPGPPVHEARRADEVVRLFDGRWLTGDAGAPAGQVLGLADGRLLVAVRGGRLAIGKLRVGAGAKVAAAEARLEAGERLR